MKKVLMFLCVLALMGFSAPAFALFTNGGFEDGNFNGWNFQYGHRPYDQANVIWGDPNNNLSAVIGPGYLESGQTTVINPYNDSKMAKINNIVGNYHATKIWQEDTIAVADLTKKIYVNWGAALIEPSNFHPQNAEPFFHIDVQKNGVVQNQFEAFVNQRVGWTKIGYNGGDLWYLPGQFTYDLSGFAVGDQIRINLYVTDCAWGGHGGFAFLDGIGTDYVPPPPGVPEPGTLLLLGSGLVGLVAFGRKFKK